MAMRKYIIMAVMLLTLCGTSWLFYSKYKTISSENLRLQNNLEYYSSQGKQNIVLQGTIKELQQSNDFLIQRIDSVRQSLKIKYKEIQKVVYIESVLRDTLRDTIPITQNFHTVIQPNEQTSIEITRADSLLTVIPTIQNNQTLFIYSESKYKYKGFFNRLIHLNFSKIRTDKYQINNSNDLITTGDTRVINVVE